MYRCFECRAIVSFCIFASIFLEFDFDVFHCTLFSPYIYIDELVLILSENIAVHFLSFKHSNVIVFCLFILLQTSRDTTLNRFGTAGHGQKAKNGPGWPHEIKVLHGINEGLVFQSIKSILQYDIFIHETVPIGFSHLNL